MKELGSEHNNSFYIANGFDVDMYSPNEKIYRNFRRKNSLPGNAKIIGNISRFHPVKNHIGMLKVFQRLKSCYPGNLILVLCGDQVDNSNSILREEIVKVNLSNDCLLLGPVESYQILPAFDVYLSASWQEGFPNVIGEAMACGVPCVVTDVGDCKYIVSQYGSVGKPGDYEALSKYCFEELIKESNKEQLRQYVIENYLIQKVVKQYEDLYRSIIF